LCCTFSTYYPPWQTFLGNYFVNYQSESRNTIHQSTYYIYTTGHWLNQLADICTLCVLKYSNKWNEITHNHYTFIQLSYIVSLAGHHSNLKHRWECRCSHTTWLLYQKYTYTILLNHFVKSYNALPEIFSIQISAIM
jgi:hypothetical protein